MPVPGEEDHFSDELPFPPLPPNDPLAVVFERLEAACQICGATIDQSVAYAARLRNGLHDLKIFTDRATQVFWTDTRPFVAHRREGFLRSLPQDDFVAVICFMEFAELMKAPLEQQQLLLPSPTPSIPTSPTFAPSDMVEWLMVKAKERLTNDEWKTVHELMLSQSGPDHPLQLRDDIEFASSSTTIEFLCRCPNNPNSSKTPHRRQLTLKHRKRTGMKPTLHMTNVFSHLFPERFGRKVAAKVVVAVSEESTSATAEKNTPSDPGLMSGNYSNIRTIFESF